MSNINEINIKVHLYTKALIKNRIYVQNTVLNIIYTPTHNIEERNLRRWRDGNEKALP